MSCGWKNKPIWLANWRHVKQANFSTHEGACSWNRPVQQICPWSLLPHIKPVWYGEAKLGSKSVVAQYIFSLEIVGAEEGALLRERVAGACCGSKLPRVYWPYFFDSPFRIQRRRCIFSLSFKSHWRTDRSGQSQLSMIKYQLIFLLGVVIGVVVVVA